MEDIRVFRVDGEKIKSLRRLKAWTQEELAKRAGLNLRTVQNAEHGGPILLDSLGRIAEALGVQPRDLILSEKRPESAEEKEAEDRQTPVRAVEDDRQKSDEGVPTNSADTEGASLASVRYS